MSVLENIDKTIKNNKVVLYMKGTKRMPMCGFSATVVNILNTLNISFVDVDVLADSTIREGIKEYANWPTIPQLFIKGEFVGGCDIVRELYSSGELQKLLENLE